ncbi:hypothetical protein B296_00031315 [Ensete ventricosum]|uniref:Uncharacterized protein n=1 Tax=Ensete ventricosum TaxID=4639 RepID=A0A426Y741_ENSVE|nr:hypothetical protein B296_00031315 [Ensete ventricosum]
MEVTLRVASALTPQRLVEGSTPHPDGSAHTHKQVKMTTRRPKSLCSEEGSWAHSKGREPAASGGKPAQPTFCHLKSMKELCGMMVCKDDKGYYALHMTDLPPRDPYSEIQAQWEALKNSARVWDDLQVVIEFERGILHP